MRNASGNLSIPHVRADGWIGVKAADNNYYYIDPKAMGTPLANDPAHHERVMEN